MSNAGKTIFLAKRGSHAVGIATENSDIDYFQIVIPPIDALIGLENMKGSQHQDSETGEDMRIITLREFIQSAVQGRSTELECIFCRDQDIVFSSPEGNDLLQNREKLVSKRFFKSLLGFVNGQRKKALNGNKCRFQKDLGYDPKSAAHGIRAMWQAIRLKQTGKLKLYIEDNDWQQIIIGIKEGRKSLIQVQKLMNKQQEIFDICAENTSLREKPDYNFWNQFLVNIHKRSINS